MSIQEQIRSRFAELEVQATQVPVRRGSGRYESDSMDVEAFQRWATSALHIVEKVFGTSSSHYRNLHDLYTKGFSSSPNTLQEMRGVFAGAKSDFDGGYLFAVQATVSGEIFGDFVTAAKAALADGQKDVAAVLACAALEDSLKRFASLRGLSVSDKEMSEVINALKAAGLLSGPQRSLVDVMPKIRNAAMHAEWTKITSQDVGSVIGFVEQFLLAKFS